MRPSFGSGSSPVRATRPEFLAAAFAGSLRVALRGLGGAGPPETGVGACTSGECVDAEVAGQLNVSSASVKVVLPLAAYENVVSGVTRDGVAATVAQQDVVTVAPGDGVHAASATDDVVASEPRDRVVAGQGDDDVVASGATQRVVAGGADDRCG